MASFVALFNIFLGYRRHFDLFLPRLLVESLRAWIFAVNYVPDLFLAEEHLALKRSCMIIVVLELFDVITASVAFS